MLLFCDLFETCTEKLSVLWIDVVALAAFVDEYKSIDCLVVFACVSAMVLIVVPNARISVVTAALIPSMNIVVASVIRFSVERPNWSAGVTF